MDAQHQTKGAYIFINGPVASAQRADVPITATGRCQGSCINSAGILKPLFH